MSGRARPGSLQEFVRGEVRHIPRGAFEQNELRMTYAIHRQHDLARDAAASAAASLGRAIRSVRQRHPDFVPTHDQDYFGQGGSHG